MLPQPAVPATTVAYTNSTGQAAYVTVTGGTVTDISVGGSTVNSATDYMATVPAGSTITLTYSVAPAWYWSTMTPAVAASGTAVANDTGQDISVVIASGTVTHVAVNGTDRATASPANVMLPAGESITLTYSVAPVWAWLNFPDLASGDSLGTAYAAENTVDATGVAGYSPLNVLPHATHEATGMTGYGVGVTN